MRKDDDETFALDGERKAPDTGDLGEFFGDLIDHMRAKLLADGYDNQAANDLINKVVLDLSETFAGQPFYVTKKPKVFARQMAMYADLQYMNHKDVDKKYGVSRGYSLKVAQQIRERRTEREQLRLDL